MKTLKRILAVTLLALGAVLLGAMGVWVLASDEILVTLLVKRVESLSDTRIAYQEGASISRTWAPELRMDQLIVDDTRGRYRIETSSLRVQISLVDLLRGRLDVPRLLIGETSVKLEQSTTLAEPAEPESRPIPLDLSLLRLNPVLHELRTSPVSILAGDDRFELPATRISEVSLRRRPRTEVAELSARLEVEGEKLLLDAKLMDLDRSLQRNQIPFEISATGTITDASAKGRFDLSQPTAFVSATLYGHIPDLNRIPGIGSEIQIPGDLVMKTQLSGPVDELALEDLSVIWTDAARSTLELRGRIADVANLSGADLALAGELAEAAWLKPLLPASLGELQSAQLTTRISGDQARLEFRELSLKARTADELNLTLAGRLELGQLLQTSSLVDLDLKVAFDAPTTRAARVLIFDDVPELGAITATGDMRSTEGDLTLENMVVKTKDRQGVEIDLRGGIARIPLGPDKPNRGYDLQIAMNATQASVMTRRVGVDLPLSGPLNLACRIQGETQALQLNRVKLSMGDKRKTVIGAEGWIQFGNWSQADPLKSTDLALWVKGRDTDLLSAWTGQPFPAVAYRAKARLHTVSGQHRIDDYELATEKSAPLAITEKGSVDSISFLPEFSVRGIRIDTRAKVDDVARLNTLFNLDQRIPAIGPADLRMLISGDDKKLLIGDLSLSAGREGTLLVEANGRVGHISAANKWRLRDTDIAITARSNSSQSMAESFGYGIPQLGPVSAQARMNDRHKTLGVEALRLVVGDPGRPALQASGSVGNLYNARKISAQAKLNLDGNDFMRFAVKRKVPDLGRLTGALMISDDDGTLGMDSLRLESSKPDILSLKVDGRFDDFSKPETLRLDLNLKARDAKPLNTLIGREWWRPGAVEIDAQLKRSDKGNLFEANMISGKEKVDMLIRANFKTNPPHVEGRITAHNFFLPDLAEKQRNKLAQTPDKKMKSKKKGPVFSRAPMDLGWMKKADVDLLVDIQTFDRDYSEAVSAELRILMKGGRLSVKPAAIAYPKGQADLELELDGRDRPRFSFSLSGENLDPWRGLKLADTGSETRFDPEDVELNVDIALDSRGRSLHEMATNAQGAVALSIKHGKMPQAELRLLFVDIVGWVSNQAKQRFEHVNCAIADYSIQQGLVTTHAFFMDLETLTIAGEGTIDLGKEQIDYTFLPRKKSRLIASAEPVTIRGPLSDPSIDALPIKSAALTLGQLVFAPYIFAGLIAADSVQDEMASGKQQSDVCANYMKDLKQAGGKQTGKKPAEKQRRKKPAKQQE